MRERTLSQRVEKDVPRDSASWFLNMPDTSLADFVRAPQLDRINPQKMLTWMLKARRMVPPETI